MPSNRAISLATAARLNPQVVGIAPEILAAIFATVIPLLTNLLRGCIPQPQPTEAQLRRKLAAEHNRDPKALRERVAVECRKEAKRQGNKIDKSQSLQMADAVIQQGLQAPDTQWSLL